MSPTTTTTQGIEAADIQAQEQIPMGLRKRKPLRPDQINWPKSQRKSRKNARRAFAAGDRRAFNK